MKCSSTEYIQPYVASTAYHSAITRQSPLRSASRLISSQESQNSSISALLRSDISSPRCSAPWRGSNERRTAPAAVALRRDVPAGGPRGLRPRRTRRPRGPRADTSGGPGTRRGPRSPSWHRLGGFEASFEGRKLAPQEWRGWGSPHLSHRGNTVVGARPPRPPKPPHHGPIAEPGHRDRLR